MTSTSHEPDATVQVTVQRLLPFGLLVTLADGRTGIIRDRELSWDRRVRQRRPFKAGDQLTVVPLGAGHDQRLELSLRLAQKDPWDDLHLRYRVGQVVSGEITGVQPYGAFVEIEPGVTGLLHSSRLPAWPERVSPTDLFWPGDQVYVAIELIDPRDRRLRLSAARALLQRWPNVTVPIPPEPPTPPDSSAAEIPATPAAPVTILVIEDDPVQLNALASWLQHSGHTTFTAASGEAALEVLATRAVDLVVSDFGLPGMTGLDVLHLIRSRWPHMRRVLMTDWARATEHTAEFEALRMAGVRLLIKPLRPSDIVALLGEDDNQIEELDSTRQGMQATISAATGLVSHGPRLESVRQILGQLARATGAARVVLLHLDPAQRKVSLAAAGGTAAVDIGALGDLIYSPVRDVAEDGQVFRAEDAQQAEPQVRYLRPFVSFRACLGIPVPTRTREHYALFLFSQRAHAFSDAHERQAGGAALAAGALLEHAQFLVHAAELQRLALLGQLSRALIHEINHQLSPINFALDDLAQQCARLDTIAEHEPPDLVRRATRAAHENLADLITGVSHLTDTARMFGRVTVQSVEQVVRLDEVIQETLALVRDMANRAHVQLDVSVPATTPAIRTRIVQVQQILLNVLINAIQQIGLARPEGGRIHVRLEVLPRELHPAVQILVEDDGPGIHRRLWERIFELGFTTRHDGGSGLGLYISRSLAEALGGRILVAASAILWGTTMLIELPAGGV